MEVKKSLPLAAALLALGISGPAAALASDGADGSDHAGAGPSVTAPSNQSGEDQGDNHNSAADEQQSGEQGDVENTDLASQVEQEDANDQTGGAQGENDNSTGDHQSGTQGDQQNSDLANEVEQEDGAGDTSGDVNQENQVDDSNDD